MNSVVKPGFKHIFSCRTENLLLVYRNTWLLLFGLLLLLICGTDLLKPLPKSFEGAVLEAHWELGTYSFGNLKMSCVCVCVVYAQW